MEIYWPNLQEVSTLHEFNPNGLYSLTLALIFQLILQYKWEDYDKDTFW